MTREILFRGFHEDENGSATIYVDGRTVNGKWVEGLLATMTTRISHINVFESDDGNELRVTTYPVIPSTVGQFTGLNDKNGRKIFEGDRCIYNSCNTNIDYEFYKGVVKFGEYYQDGSGDEYAPCKVIGFYLKRQSTHCGELAYDGMSVYEPDYLEEDTVFKDYIEVTGTIFDKPHTDEAKTERVKDND